jgi:hypothetical protein
MAFTTQRKRCCRRTVRRNSMTVLQGGRVHCLSSLRWGGIDAVQTCFFSGYLHKYTQHEHGGMCWHCCCLMCKDTRLSAACYPSVCTFFCTSHDWTAPCAPSLSVIFSSGQICAAAQHTVRSQRHHPRQTLVELRFYQALLAADLHH